MYSARQVASVLGLPSNRLRAFLRAGVVQPEKNDGGELCFSFQDLVVLRRMCGPGGSLPPRRLGRAMRRLQGVAGNRRPFSGISLHLEGSQIVIADGGHKWRADSGQLLMDFPPAAKAISRPNASEPGLPDVVSLAEIRRARHAQTEATREPSTAQEYFEHACRLEDIDPEGARRAYERAVELDPEHADVRVNLGRLLHESGHPDAALVHYQAALTVRPNDPTAAFNMGVALEDTGRTREAIGAYQASIAADPSNADAHYNLARLLDLAGRADAAFQHLVIYRQLTQARR